MCSLTCTSLLGTVQVDLDTKPKREVHVDTKATVDWNGFPARLREGLAKKRLSHRSFASRVGVSVQSVTGWLDGAHMKTESLPQVAKVLSMTIDELLGQPVHAQPTRDEEATDAAELGRCVAQLASGAEPIKILAPDLMQLLQDAEEYVEKHGPSRT